MIRQMRKWLAAEALALACCVGAAPLRADEPPRQHCARVGNDDVVRPTTPALADAIRKLFDISGQYALDSTVYRCVAGHVMLCYEGANLPCGKADMRKSMPEADAWCRANPNSDFIPMVITGHDTPYGWRCVNGRAEAGEIDNPIDARGFFVDYWKELK